MRRAIGWSIWSLLCLAIVVAWVASYWRYHVLHFSQTHWHVAASVSMGRFRVSWHRIEGGNARFSGEIYYTTTQPFRHGLPRPSGAHFYFARGAFIVSAESHKEYGDWRSPPEQRMPPYDEHNFELMLPIWFVFSIVAGVGAIVGVRAYRRRKRDREGLCPVCGYDLRATPERCPECGHAGRGGIIGVANQTKEPSHVA